MKKQYQLEQTKLKQMQFKLIVVGAIANMRNDGQLTPKEAAQWIGVDICEIARSTPLTPVKFKSGGIRYRAGDVRTFIEADEN